MKTLTGVAEVTLFTTIFSLLFLFAAGDSADSDKWFRVFLYYSFVFMAAYTISSYHKNLLKNEKIAMELLVSQIGEEE